MASLIEDELSHGYEMARQLEAQLSSSSVELQLMVRELIGCLEKTKSMVKSSSPWSFTGESEHPFDGAKKRMISKKRKSQARCTKQVKLGTGPEAEGPLDDGYGWRKYGQKEILGAKFPRAYYRCTHRDTQGCLARKQVQNSDNNPLIFEVTYHGTHTCLQNSSLPNHGHDNNQQLLLSFQTNLKVETETENFDLKFQDPTSSFSFPPTPMGSCFEGSFNTAFISPTASESNYFSASPCGMSSYGGPGIQASESDFTEIMSSLSSEFGHEFLTEFDADFQTDLSNFFV